MYLRYTFGETLELKRSAVVSQGNQQESKEEVCVKSFPAKTHHKSHGQQENSNEAGHQIWGQAHKWWDVVFNVLCTSWKDFSAYSRGTMARFNYTVRKHCPCLSFCLGHIISCRRFSHPGLKHPLHFWGDLAPKVTDFLNTEVLNSRSQEL